MRGRLVLAVLLGGTLAPAAEHRVGCGRVTLLRPCSVGRSGHPGIRGGDVGQGLAGVARPEQGPEHAGPEPRRTRARRHRARVPAAVAGRPGRRHRGRRQDLVVQRPRVGPGVPPLQSPQTNRGTGAFGPSDVVGGQRIRAETEEDQEAGCLAQPHRAPGLLGGQGRTAGPPLRPAVSPSIRRSRVLQLSERCSVVINPGTEELLFFFFFALKK
uniref:Putative secreted protein n=1 Tax=Ixodes ricinus TaxID=34613 RepID=A0A6B0V3D8_IXORI